MDPRGRLTTTVDWRHSHPSLSLTGYSEREPAKTSTDVIDQLSLLDADETFITK